MTAADMIPLSCARIIDEIIMVQKIRGNEETIAEVAGSMMFICLHEGTDNQRIYEIFEVYRDNSLNNPEGGKKGSENGHDKFRILKIDHKIYRWW